jgi:hypothetical protein
MKESLDEKDRILINEKEKNNRFTRLHHEGINLGMKNKEENINKDEIIRDL